MVVCKLPETYSVDQVVAVCDGGRGREFFFRVGLISSMEKLARALLVTRSDPAACHQFRALRRAQSVREGRGPSRTLPPAPRRPQATHILIDAHPVPAQRMLRATAVCIFRLHPFFHSPSGGTLPVGMPPGGPSASDARVAAAQGDRSPQLAVAAALGQLAARAQPPACGTRRPAQPEGGRGRKRMLAERQRWGRGWPAGRWRGAREAGSPSSWPPSPATHMHATRPPTSCACQRWHAWGAQWAPQAPPPPPPPPWPGGRAPPSGASAQASRGPGRGGGFGRQAQHCIVGVEPRLLCSAATGRTPGTARPCQACTHLDAARLLWLLIVAGYRVQTLLPKHPHHSLAVLRTRRGCGRGDRAGQAEGRDRINDSTRRSAAQCRCPAYARAPPAPQPPPLA